MRGFGGREEFLFGQPVAVASHGGQEILRLPVADGAHTTATPMRSRADSGVILVTPVGEVVPALGARPGVVGDFIGRDACPGRPLLRHFE